jgi:Na+/H+ antiporter NhaD/arsenite permease-like protein
MPDATRPLLRPVIIGGSIAVLALVLIALLAEGTALTAEILLAGLVGLGALLWWERRERRREDEEHRR